MARRLLLAFGFMVALASHIGCVPLRPVPPTPDRTVEFTLTCTTIWQEELGRPIDPLAITECIRRAKADETGETIRAGVHASEEAVAHRDALAHPKPTLPNAGEKGGFRVFDKTFHRNSDGSTFPWVGVSEFRLFEIFIKEGKDGVDRVLTDLLTKPDGTFYAPGEGPNLLRVFGMYSCQRAGDACVPNTGIGWFTPTELPDYYDKLGLFIDVIAARGFTLEFVIFADAQILMGDAVARGQHLDRVMGVLAAKAQGSAEVANEPFKNLPGGGSEAAALASRVRGRGIPVASGDYDIPNCAIAFPHGDYVTVHTDRKEDWVRTARALGEVRDGFGWGPDCPPNSAFGGVGVPVVGDEPEGFAEVGILGKRSASPDDAAWHAAGCQMFGAGCTFHSDAGVYSAPLGPVQRASLAAWVQAAHWVPVNAQLWPYQRGGMPAGCRGWVGDAVVEHDDAVELRTFAKTNPLGNESWADQMRTTRTHATPCGGWRVESTLRSGLIHLVK